MRRFSTKWIPFVAMASLLGSCSDSSNILGRPNTSHSRTELNGDPLSVDAAIPGQGPESADDSGTVEPPVSVGGAYLVCEMNTSVTMPAGMSSVGCSVKNNNQTLAFADYYSSTITLNNAGTPITDVVVEDFTKAPAPYHWVFTIANTRLVASEAVVILTQRGNSAKVSVFKAPLPSFPGTDVNVQFGFNFDDVGVNNMPDRDFNDVVVCLKGKFRYGAADKLFVSQADQSATLTYSKKADCTQELQVQYTDPGSSTVNVFLDTVEIGVQQKTFNFKSGTKLEVKFKVGAPCPISTIDMFNRNQVSLRAEACGNQ